MHLSAIIILMDSPAATDLPTLHTIFLDGPAGRIEALLDPGLSQPDLAPAPYAAIIAHPHPLGGGSMHNKVVYHAARVFRDLGWPTLRFNFRGVGLSEGTHDGRAEADDLDAALDWLDVQFRLPILAAGFSFGAAMTLAAVPRHPSVRACLALGLPLHSPNQQYTYPQLAHWTLPTLFLSGDQDIFASPDELRAAIVPAVHHARLEILPDADHFFTGQLLQMQHTIRTWLATLSIAPTEPSATL